MSFDFQAFRIINQLKTVDRQSTVGKRKESSAEHTWSAIMLADALLPVDSSVNRQRVFELLLYHDLVEVHAGDTPLKSALDLDEKAKKEMAAAEELRNSLPSSIADKFYHAFLEFEAKQSQESIFAKAIDALDVIIQELDHPHDWKGWSKDFLIEKKKDAVSAFPETKALFEELLKYLQLNNYFKPN